MNLSQRTTGQPARVLGVQGTHRVSGDPILLGYTRKAGWAQKSPANSMHFEVIRQQWESTASWPKHRKGFISMSPQEPLSLDLG